MTRPSVLTFQDTLKAEGVCSGFFLVRGERNPVLLCFFQPTFDASANPMGWIEIPLSEILHNQPEALEKVRAAHIIHQNF